MEVFKSNDNSKKEHTYDILQDGEHLLIGKDNEGRLVVALYYDDINHEYEKQESFLINNSNYYIYFLFEKLFASCGNNKQLVSLGNSNLFLTEEENGYRLNFFLKKESNKSMMEAKFNCISKESKPIIEMFSKLQEYDPRYHQMHMSELLEGKVLKKKKVVERKRNV